MRPLRVLLVEDNPAEADLATEVLGAEYPSMQLTVVTNGVEAVDCLKRRGRFSSTKRPDLVFLDLNLPRMDGRQVLAEIKADESLRGIPVVVLSSSAAEVDVSRSYELGANCYVTKPVDFLSFQSIIATIQQFWFEVVRLPPNNGVPSRVRP